MKILVFIAFITFSSCTAFAQLVSMNQAEIAKLKASVKNDSLVKRFYQDFEKSATIYLNDRPNPIDTIRSEGLLKGNPQKERTSNALRDMYKMYTLALTYKINGDKKYLNQSVEFLKAWAKKNQPNGDPIDDTNLDKAIEAYDLIKEDLSSADKDLIAGWLSRTALTEINSKRMQGNRGTAVNNWNAHRLKVVGEIGYALNNQQYISWTIENFKKHIGINLNEDGTSLDFKLRDAMHYHIYDLEPMLKLAILIKRAGGENFYSYQSPKGSSIKKSVEWLVPYVKGEKQHEEYVNTTVKFDRDRAKNNEPGFAPGSMFKPSLALPVFELSVYFDPQQDVILQQLQKSKSWTSVLNEIKQVKM